MPGHDSFDTGVDLRELFVNTVGPKVAELFQGAAQMLLPDCYGCAKKSVPIRCKRCQGYSCTDHAYINIGRREVLCLRCINQMIRAEGGDTGFDEEPWLVLEIEPKATKEQVESAFRQKARECHPDLHPEDKAKAREWARLSWARETMLLLIEEQRKG